jgi:hypothetical protein
MSGTGRIRDRVEIERVQADLSLLRDPKGVWERRARSGRRGSVKKTGTPYFSCARTEKEHIQQRPG